MNHPRHWNIVGLALTTAVVLCVPSSRADQPEIDAELRARESVFVNPDWGANAETGLAAPETNNFASLRTRVGLAFEANEKVAAYIQFQDTRSFGEPASTTTSLEQVDLHQGYIDAYELFYGLNFRVGRQELAYGGQRQIGTTDWDNVGRVFDGLLVTRDLPGFGWVHLFGMKLNETGGIPSAKVGSGLLVEQALMGIYLHHSRTEEWDIEAYVIDFYRDEGNYLDAANPDPTEQRDALGNFITAGARVSYHSRERGLRFWAEGAGQYGTIEIRGELDPLIDRLIPIGSTEYDLGGYAATAGLRFDPSGIQSRWFFGLEGNFASGDDDPSDDQLSTYVQLFPTTHTPLGLMDRVGWMNTLSGSITAGFKPTPSWRLWASFHQLQLADTADSWYSIDGLDSPVLEGIDASGFGSALAQEIDLSSRVEVSENLSVLGVLAVWVPGDYQTKYLTALAASEAGDPSLPELNLSPELQMHVQMEARF